MEPCSTDDDLRHGAWSPLNLRRLIFAPPGIARQDFIITLVSFLPRGKELTLQEGYAAARQTMLNLLSAAKATLGNLDRVECVVKLNGYVNSTPDFDRQPEVINGASDLLEQVFGEQGRHARTSIGVNILPGNIPVEIEMVLQVSS